MVSKKWTGPQTAMAGIVIVLMLFGTYELAVTGLTPAPPTVTIGPKALNSGGTLGYASGSPISEVDLKLKTYDAWSAYNTINMSLVVHMPTVQVGSKVYLVLVETSFNSSILTGPGAIPTFLSIVALDGDLYNITLPGKIYPGTIIDASDQVSAPQAGSYTLLGLVIPPSGPAVIEFTPQALFVLGPYTDYIQAVADRLTAQIANNSAAQTKGGDIMEALTWIVLGSAFLTILVDMRRK